MDSKRDGSRGNGNVSKKLWLALGPAVAVVAYTSVAEATTYTVTLTGGPAALGKGCSLTQALQAANTNQSVNNLNGKGGCAAGSRSGTDTIVLTNGALYSLYGSPLNVRANTSTIGGKLIIRSNSSTGTPAILRGHDYGYPSSNGPNEGTCPYPAAIFSAGTDFTLKDVDFQADGPTFTGICQYSGTITLDNVEVGDPGDVWVFARGGLFSVPNTGTEWRTVNILNSEFAFNFSPLTGGGVALYGGLTTNITNSYFYYNETNEDGGGVSWRAEGNSVLNVTDTWFEGNFAHFSNGGGLNINPLSTTATANLTRVNMQVNGAEYTGGGIFIGNLVSANSVDIIDSDILNNSSWLSNAEGQFNTDFAYDAIECKQFTWVNNMNMAPWNQRSPPLKGDGTCQFQQF